MPEDHPTPPDSSERPLSPDAATPESATPEPADIPEPSSPEPSSLSPAGDSLGQVRSPSLSPTDSARGESRAVAQPGEAPDPSVIPDSRPKDSRAKDSRAKDSRPKDSRPKDSHSETEAPNPTPASPERSPQQRTPLRSKGSGPTRSLRQATAVAKVAGSRLLQEAGEGLLDFSQWLAGQTTDADAADAEAVSTALWQQFGRVWQPWGQWLDRLKSPLPKPLRRTSNASWTGILVGLLVFLFLAISSTVSRSAPEPNDPQTDPQAPLVRTPQRPGGSKLVKSRRRPESTPSSDTAQALTKPRKTTSAAEFFGAEEAAPKQAPEIQTPARPPSPRVPTSTEPAAGARSNTGFSAGSSSGTAPPPSAPPAYPGNYSAYPGNYAPGYPGAYPPPYFYPPPYPPAAPMEGQTVGQTAGQTAGDRPEAALPFSQPYGFYPYPYPPYGGYPPPGSSPVPNNPALGNSAPLTPPVPNPPVFNSRGQTPGGEAAAIAPLADTPGAPSGDPSRPKKAPAR